MPAKRTVLVVDDEEVVRDVAHAILRHYGYETLLAQSAEGAIALMRDHPDEIDLVLLDAGTTKWPLGDPLLLALSPDLPLLLSSGAAPEEALQHFDRRRVSGFIQKPYTASCLRNAVSLALHTRCIAA